MTHRVFVEEYINSISNMSRTIPIEEFKKAVELIQSAYREDRQIFLAGNGGSAATCNHFVCDFGKNVLPLGGCRRFRLLSLCDSVEKITAFANDLEYADVFHQQLVNLVNDGDLLITISASGDSPNIIRAIEYAKTRNCHVIALTGFSGGRSRELADAKLHVPAQSYEQAEDIHSVLCHILVGFFKTYFKHDENIML